MRILIISDIHANLTALETVLAHAQGQWDKIWCLGDLVGYGPDPNECVQLIQQFDHIALSGNHDWAVLGRLDVTTFNRDAQIAIEWTRKTITAETRAYLETLPSSITLEPFTLAHASPRQPVWEYILDSYTAAMNFSYFDTPYCLVGHTHVPVLFEEVDITQIVAHTPIYDVPIQLEKPRLIINPGSVGQPRDADPRAAYALLDTDAMTWEFRRVRYPISETQERMRKFDIPPRLIQRLEYGL
ncbi:MAG: metallophosphoesterase [Chloroflexi bacterium]|nr:MAG: metallophosphoesterase [Chloroflexota bacterium]